jgi:hypothetical protein
MSGRQASASLAPGWAGEAWQLTMELA